MTDAARPAPGARWPPRALGLLVIGAIGWLDQATGPDISMSLLYLAPTVALAWAVGPAEGVLAALLGAAAWTWADVAGHGGLFLAVTGWNGFTRLVIFIGAAVATARVRSDRDALQRLNARLSGLLEREQELARTDALTGLPNSRAFRERLDEDLRRLRRGHGQLAVAYLDLDDFKGVNDGYGHAAGDALLRRVGEVLRRSVRAGDIAARLGGDEFGLLLWDADPAVVGAVTERIVTAIRELGAELPRARLGASIGVVHLTEPPASSDAALGAADQALYAAKVAGKGRVRLAIAPGGGEGGAAEGAGPPGATLRDGTR